MIFRFAGFSALEKIAEKDLLISLVDVDVPVVADWVILGTVGWVDGVGVVVVISLLIFVDKLLIMDDKDLSEEISGVVELSNIINQFFRVVNLVLSDVGLMVYKFVNAIQKTSWTEV